MLVRTVTCTSVAGDGILSRAEDLQYVWDALGNIRVWFYTQDPTILLCGAEIIRSLCRRPVWV